MVFTPLPLARQIIEHFTPCGKVLDPCMGQGVFYLQFPDSVAREWAEIEMGRDFMSIEYDTHFDWVISNPPWSKISQFMNKAMTISDNIVFLAIINHFTTKKRLRDIKAFGFCIREFYGVEQPAAPWPSSGFQLVACHLQRGYTGPIHMTGTLA
jgi:hypothetical protein